MLLKVADCWHDDIAGEGTGQPLQLFARGFVCSRGGGVADLGDCVGDGGGARRRLWHCCGTAAGSSGTGCTVALLLHREHSNGNPDTDGADDGAADDGAAEAAAVPHNRSQRAASDVARRTNLRLAQSRRMETGETRDGDMHKQLTYASYVLLATPPKPRIRSIR